MKRLRTDFTKRLPDDLLTMVMWEFVFEDDLQSLVRVQIPTYRSNWDAHRPSWRRRQFKAVLVSSICQRWRTVALNYPRIWSQIHLSWPTDTIRMYTSRCKTHILSIGINSYSVTSKNFAIHEPTLLNSLSRVERLSIECGNSLYLDYNSRKETTDFLDWVTRVHSGDTAAPRLWQLHCDLYERAEDAEKTPNLPKLSDIRFNSVSLRAVKSNWGRLERVKARSHDLDDSEVIDFLMAAQNLESIELVHYEEEDVPEDKEYDDIAGDTQLSPTFLPKVNKFQIAWCPVTLAESILRAITFPSTSLVEFCICRRQGAGFIETFPNYLLGVLRSVVVLDIEAERSDCAFSFNSIDSPSYEIKFNEPRGLSDMDSEIQDCYSQEQADEIFDSLGQQSFHCLVDVSIYSAYSSDASIMRKLFREFQTVQNLTFRAKRAENVIEALASDPGDSDHRHPCPALRKLDFRECRFDPVTLKKTLINRREWAPDLRHLQVTIDPRMFESCEENVGNVRRKALRSVAGLVTLYEAKEGEWRDTNDSDSDL
ncbi:hypothetical protein SISNIDRAFT_484479 [Sistotremastrum niveocremeum HHB9708]|uniref:F-box domain-containing protein n=1 Tax=Sistotremastrum niveocremeum HHB9708 TaxID=1314777 RepID=A0A164WDS5_9AGAM|nr:hypothetical protein SISNIDRAFT_484479 [Sistotremastrum niveocremeum HHB9708]